MRENAWRERYAGKLMSPNKALEILKPGQRVFIGSARYYVDRATGLAEYAIEVQDGWQNRGAGGVLFEHLMRIARIKGVKGLVGYVLDSNTRAYRLMTRTGLPIETKWEDGVYTMTMRFEDAGR